MANELVKSADGLEDIMRLGKVFKASGYFSDIRDEAQAIVKILYGKELGLSPVVAMMSIHIIQGKPELSSNLLASQVKTSGRYDYRVLAQTDTECHIQFLAGSEVIGDSIFTIEDAKRANLVRGGGNWTKFPKAMLFARALSQGVRSHCPDVGLGAPLYVAGEISGEDKQPREDTQKTEKVRVVVPEKNDEAPPETPDPKPEPESAAPKKDGPFITPAQQRALHSMAQEHLDIVVRGQSPTEYQKRKQLGEWLAKKGYATEDGKGSTKTIPKDEFLQVKDEFMEYIRSVKDMADSVNEATA